MTPKQSHAIYMWQVASELRLKWLRATRWSDGHPSRSAVDSAIVDLRAAGLDRFTRDYAVLGDETEG